MTAIYHLFPATIHPMVVHFTIAIIYLAGLFGLIGLIRRKDSFWVKAFVLTLVLGILATIAAGVAGVISESYDKIPPAVQPILNAHKRDGELTGVTVVIALFVQLIHTRMRKVSWIAYVFCVIAVILVSITGHLGGTMVYNHGLGVLGITRK
ncbi:DUF2231 domain-containing protein [Alicyclobacillus mengziensis]|nr:DUF2231 domain-containing protein [Alicyclobacillus mengziensis]